MDPTKGQDSSPQRGRTQQGSKIQTSPKSRRTPWKVKTAVHNVDGPNKGRKISPQSGRIPRRVKTPIHNMDGPNKGKKLKQVHNVDGPNKGRKLK